MAFSCTTASSPGGKTLSVAVGPDLVGRVLDGFGQPIDRRPPIRPAAYYPLIQPPGSPLDREHIIQPIVTGIRAIDTLMPVGTGQRMGIFGGSGVGKSTLLGAMARHNSADVTVIALIGERNREVRAFLEHELGPEGSKRSVVVCSTSDRPAPLRVRACFVALAIAEYFRDQGANVLLDHGFRHASGHGPTRNRPGRRRTAQPERLHAFRLQPAAQNPRARRQFPDAAPSPASSPCWSKGTILTSPSATPCAPFWTVTSSCRAVWRRGALSGHRRSALGQPAGH